MTVLKKKLSLKSSCIISLNKFAQSTGIIIVLHSEQQTKRGEKQKENFLYEC